MARAVSQPYYSVGFKLSQLQNCLKSLNAGGFRRLNAGANSQCQRQITVCYFTGVRAQGKQIYNWVRLSN